MIKVGDLLWCVTDQHVVFPVTVEELDGSFGDDAGESVVTEFSYEGKYKEHAKAHWNAYFKSDIWVNEDKTLSKSTVFSNYEDAVALAIKNALCDRSAASSKVSSLTRTINELSSSQQQEIA